MKKKLVSLLLCICLIAALLPGQAMATTAITKITITMSDLKVGKPLPTDAKTAANASTKVTKVEWTGQHDNGVMMYDVLNPVVITVKIKEGKDARFSPNKATSATINNRKATVERLDDTTALVRYTFEAAKSEALKAAEKNNTVIPMDVMVTIPNEAETPDTAGKILGNGVVYYSITGIKWAGEMDANGKFKAGVPYTVTVSAKILDSRPSVNFYSLNNEINNKAADVISVGGKEITCSYTFPAFEPKAVVAEKEAAEKAEQDAKHEAYVTEQEAKKHAAEVERRWSKAEADANYPLGHALTIVVSEDNVDMAEVSQWGAWTGWQVEKRGTSITNVLGEGFYTLDGEFIDTSGAERINKNYSDTFHTYRPTRVVYDLYRKIDFSLAEEVNVKEFWLSPKCDIQGILDNIGREELPSDWGGDRDRFGTYDHILFIPDTLYPNGPKYTVNTIPGCRVMLYSGDDVYAAAKKGKEAARDWCTNHSFTYKYMSPDRRYTFASCTSDERFFYSCSKCGKCEKNPNHTFVGGWDQHEGQFSAHNFDKRDISDEHFLGLNANGDRVYVRSCTVCGKDMRQVDVSETYEHAVATKGQISREDYQYALNQTKANWAAGGSFYKWALEATPEDDTTRSFAVSKDTYVWAKVSDWAKNDVQDASDAGLIDVNLLGLDYTKPVNRLQFASVAVKMAEKMTGKAITPAPVGTFTDTDNEYARKAYAAGITTGVTATTFDPLGSLSRQQMATFLYRALQYVKANSDTEYTIYTPKLSSYTDAGQIASWANEAMGFMNALGLVNGTTATTLAPNANSTVEQALIVAYRSLDAGYIGWYQCAKSVKAFGHYSDLATHYAYGDRIWITSSSGHCTDPYGKAGGVDLRDFYAIKDR